MNTIKIIPLTKPVQKEITVPGCLSYTIRALALAAFVKGDVKIINPLKSDDTSAMINILTALGIKIEEGENYFTVHGDIANIKDKVYKLNVNISGRTARIMTAFLCVVPGVKILTCGESFKKRPVKDLVDGLKQLGAEIIYLEKEGYLPIKILSNKLNPGEININGSISSQYISGIMMIAPRVGEITINALNNQASKPFIDITIDIMKKFGIEVINKDYKKYIIKNGQKYKNPKEYIVEADAISASYFLGIAAITKSYIKILNLNPKSLQGDIHFVDILEKMGCKIDKNEKENWIAVQGTNKLNGITIDMNNMPDTVPTLAVVSAFANGITHITGLSHLKIKETDRIEAPKTELKKIGIDVKSTNNSLTIKGGNPKGEKIKTYNDHRMAMAFAMIGTKISGIEIEEPMVVNKSFPDFWKKLKEINL